MSRPHINSVLNSTNARNKAAIAKAKKRKKEHRQRREKDLENRAAQLGITVAAVRQKIHVEGQAIIKRNG